MSIIRKAVSKFIKPLVGSTAVYNVRDQKRIAIALQCHEYVSGNPAAEVTPEVIDGFYQRVESMSQDAARKFVHQSINRQVEALFQLIHDEAEQQGGEFRPIPPITGEGDKEYSELVRKLYASATSPEGKPWVDLKEIPYHLEVKPSTINGADDGVFIRVPDGGQIMPGALVCLYPGLIHVKEHLRDRAYLESLLPDTNFALMSRVDQTLIDARGVADCAPNPFAMGHKINHCGTEKPNIIQATYDFPEDMWKQEHFPTHLRQYIPNKLARPATLFHQLESRISDHMKGLVFLASAPLSDGDELLMDYKLNPEVPGLPSWYRPYDRTEARLRWGIHNDEEAAEAKAEATEAIQKREAAANASSMEKK